VRTGVAPDTAVVRGVACDPAACVATGVPARGVPDDAGVAAGVPKPVVPVEPTDPAGAVEAAASPGAANADETTGVAEVTAAPAAVVADG
jgi:hypothetical protein